MYDYQTKLFPLLTGVACGLLFLTAALVSAQDPFDDAPPPQADPTADVATEPKDAPAKKAQKKQIGKQAVEVAPRQYPLAVQVVLESKPRTPADLVRATATLINLAEPELAKPFVEQLQSAQLDDAQLAALIGHLGSAPFFKIAGEPLLKPEGAAFANRVFAASAKVARDPARLAALVDQLGDPSLGRQQLAAAELLNAHEHAAFPLIVALGDPNKSSIHRRAFEVLVALGDDAVQPLLAALDSQDDALRAAAARVLGELRAFSAIGVLAGIATSPGTTDALRRVSTDAVVAIMDSEPTLPAAARLLHRELGETLSGQRPLSLDPNGLVPLWVWDATTKQPISVRLPPDAARAYLAARPAGQLLNLLPEQAEDRLLIWTALLQADAYRAGLDSPPPTDENSAFAIAEDQGVGVVENVLSYAMGNGYMPAATVAAQILGGLGDQEALKGVAGKPSALVLAARSDDRRLRFAAIEAIVKLEPNDHFPGLSYLTDGLVYFATGFGQRSAVVRFPNPSIAQQLAGMLNSLGFEAVAATNGRDLFLTASRSNNYELILLSSRLDRPETKLLYQELRKDPRTAQTPIILLAEDEELPDLRDRIGADRLAVAMVRPSDLRGMQFVVESAMARAGDRILPAEVRARQAAAALKWMSELQERNPKLFDFRGHEQRLTEILYVPTLSPLTAAILSQHGTHFSQQTLLALANRNTQPLVSREAAAAAFGESVRRFGVRLTKPEIRQQYSRYNASETEDQASQELLGSILDAIELPTKIKAETGG
jgi:DNA-binding response OmpR family regulator